MVMFATQVGLPFLDSDVSTPDKILLLLTAAQIQHYWCMHAARKMGLDIYIIYCTAHEVLDKFCLIFRLYTYQVYDCSSNGQVKGELSHIYRFYGFH